MSVSCSSPTKGTAPLKVSIIFILVILQLIAFLINQIANDWYSFLKVVQGLQVWKIAILAQLKKQPL